MQTPPPIPTTRRPSNALVHVVIVVAILVVTFLFLVLPTFRFNERSWSFVSGGPEYARYQSHLGERQLIATVTPPKIRHTSTWQPADGPCPVPIERAIVLGSAALAAGGFEFVPTAWQVDDASLHRFSASGPDHFFYSVAFGRIGGRDRLTVIVLLDGSTILPE